MSAFCDERMSRHVSSRWTMSWSVPCDAMVKTAPPRTPAQSVYVVERFHERSMKSSLPASAPFSRTAGQPPGTSTWIATIAANAPSR
jgi:hypothetical protein